MATKAEAILKPIPVACPHCDKLTNIPAKRTTGKTTLTSLPGYEVGKCTHCKGKIIVFFDLRVVKIERYA